jgi:hypothetical protein
VANAFDLHVGYTHCQEIPLKPYQSLILVYSILNSSYTATLLFQHVRKHP